MRLRIGFGLLVMAFVTSAAATERWVDFSNDRPFSEARIEVGLTGANTVEFDLVIPGVAVERVTTEAGVFTKLSVPGMGRIGRTGEPMLPALRRFVEIPWGATATVRSTVLDRATVNLAAEGLSTVVFPVQLPMPKCDCPEADDWRFSYSTKAYQGVVDYGQPTFDGPFGLRDHRMLLVTTSPATYDVAAGTVEIATRTRVTVEISGGDAAATATVKNRLSSRHYDAFLGGAAINLNLTEAGGWAYPDDAPVEFLIITPPQFVADLAPFVEWKTSTGYEVSVETTDVTGTTTTAIKGYISGLYSGANPPVYILMIGDSPSPLATYTPSGGGTGGTDLPYVQMDGDLYPDMMIARWPIDDSAELVNMRDKILHYEQPTAANSAWLNRALYLAGSGYQGTVTTHEEVIAQLMEPPPNSAECDLWYDSNSPTTSELIADLNTGRAWMVYSAHCGSSGMVGDPPFNSPDVPNLANADQYPLGIGHCCLSNQWATNDDVFGEVTVIQPDKGFVSYWGGSNSTYWDEDDWLEKGFFDAFFDDDMAGNIGDWDRLYSNIAACYAGLSEVTLRGGNETYYWPMYNLNGDPTLDPFTRAPIAVTVGAPPVVPPVADTFTVTVTDTAIGAVPLAMVGVTQDGVLLGAGLTDPTGTAVFPIDAPLPGSDLLVRVTAHNHLPTDAVTMVAAGSDGVVVLDGTIYRCDSVVTIDVFDEDLEGEPPFNVDLSSPSGGSVPVQVSSVGVGIVQYRGTALLGTELVVSHGEVLTVTYDDANTGSGSPGVKTDTAVLDCAGPVISDLGVFDVGADSAVVRWNTDESGDSWAQISPGGMVVSDAGFAVEHELIFSSLQPCAVYTITVASADALGNSTVSAPTLPFETYMQSIALDDDVESGPGGWTVDTVVNPGTGTNWSIVTDAGTSSPTHAWFTSDEDDIKDDRLESGPITLGGGSPVLTFWHHFATESGYDGGVLEVSTDGSTWIDVEDAGGIFLSGGYNDSVSSYSSNPLTTNSDRAVWAGSGPLQQVEVDLTALAGGNLWIRFRFGCDSSVSGTGWWVDDIKIETTAPCDMLFGDGFEVGDCSNWSMVVGEQ
jgi:hypothetical protein